MCQGLIKYKIMRKQFQERLEELNVGRRHLFDNEYYYTLHEDWGRVFYNVLMGMPRYITEAYDCDDFAFSLKARVSERYKLNTVGIVIGGHPWGYHAWNCFLSEHGIFFIEPQTGDVFTPDLLLHSVDIVIC